MAVCVVFIWNLNYKSVDVFSQNLLIDKNRDFTTQEDEQGQLRLRELVEQRRKGWGVFSISQLWTMFMWWNVLECSCRCIFL